MKEDLQHPDVIEIYAPDFDCDIDGNSDSLPAIDQDLHMGSIATLSFDFQSSKYRLPPPLSNRLVFEHIQPIFFQHSLVNLKTETKTWSKVNDTIQHPDLEWQMEEDLGDNCLVDKYGGDT